MLANGNARQCEMRFFDPSAFAQLGIGCPWLGSLLETLPVGHPVFHGHSFRGCFEGPKALERKAILSTEAGTVVFLTHDLYANIHGDYVYEWA